MFRSSTNPPPSDSQRLQINWSLLMGCILVFIILILSLLGPMMAPNDPREQKLIIQVNGKWKTPPYPAFTPGYPLGSDNLGRDLYSWLLWSIRPTMMLVIIVASIRMILGVVIGVIAGWSDRATGRLCDWLIAGALAVPTLIAALIIITAVGFKLGVWAFVVGMSVTGWAETAQLVREQTRTIRGQEAIEASIALGSSSSQTFFLHILPQVMPMIWMLLAFEVANSLVTSAGLGFLGYYLGGAVFTVVDDFVYQRISEMPELGQMLATAWLVLDEPWAMVAAGTVVFFIVLAFNLIGDGLQSRLTRKLGGMRTLYSFVAGDAIPWLDKKIFEPITKLSQRQSFQYNTGAIIILLLGAFLVWRVDPWAGYSAGVPPKNLAVEPTIAADGDESINASGEDEASSGENGGQSEGGLTTLLHVPGDHIWSGEGHDPWHARWVDFSGPLTTTIQWTLEREGGFVGGPAIDARGILYIAACEVSEDAVESGTLIALDDKGTIIWETAIDNKPVGSPALNPEGIIYVADKQGINAVSPEGALLWQYINAEGDPTADGPVVSPDGSIYFKSYEAMNALTPDGSLRWRTGITESAASQPPHLNVDGSVIIWQDLAFNTSDGSAYDWSVLTPWDIPPAQVAIGADGQTYLRYGERIIRPTTDIAALDEAMVFDGSALTWDSKDTGVTSSGRVWLIARPSTGGMGLRLFWATPGGELSSSLAIPSQRNVQVIGVDINDTAYICMDSYEAESRCIAASPETNRAVSNLPLRGINAISGAALAPGRLYIATREGFLYAVGADADEAEDQSTIAPAPALVDPGPAWSQPDNPGGHIWPMPGSDPWGTLWTQATGPRDAAIKWTFEAPLGLAGAPVIAKDGTLYACTKGTELIALDSSGQLLWRVPTSSGLIGSPALASDGTIYVTDEGGYLNAFDPNGKLLWRYHPTGIVNNPTYSRSGQILREAPMPIDALGPAGAGPIVTPDGTIYYSLGIETWQHGPDIYFRSEVMIAVSPDGEGLFDPPSFIGSNRLPARLYTDGERIIWGDVMVYPLDGAIDRDKPYPYGEFIGSLFDEYGNIQPYVGMGADGRAYLTYRRTIITWFVTEAGVGEVHTFEWEPETSPGSAKTVGATPHNLRWLFFANGKFIWIDQDDTVTGPVRFPLESMVIAVDSQDTAYGCGSSMGKAMECMAYNPESMEARWHLTLGEGETVIGGALAPGTLYVATENGNLYALGD